MCTKVKASLHSHFSVNREKARHRFGGNAFSREQLLELLCTCRAMIKKESRRKEKFHILLRRYREYKPKGAQSCRSCSIRDLFYSVIQASYAASLNSSQRGHMLHRWKLTSRMPSCEMTKMPSSRSMTAGHDDIRAFKNFTKYSHGKYSFPLLLVSLESDILVPTAMNQRDL
ncbi:hypothetical protein SASPL_136400 [Salvia splendens]|uniref:Uncharacterized protein n=1 Tax=Salvia splendens TaxID=180675 RepID=A0A8X8WY50_SALSN|nr:hypothetical protein SASPL_136400 [Salvia splendens]